jgi:hypothetical protein
MSSGNVISTLKTVGLSAKGAVYLAIGALALMAAFDVSGQSEKDADNAGAFEFLQQTAGSWILIVLAAGLACYCAWRMYEAFAHEEKRPLRKRLRYFFSSLSYTALAFSAFKLASAGESSDGNPFRKYAAQAMQLEWGEWLVVLAGLIFISAGVYQIGYGISGKYRKHVQGLNLHNDASAALSRTGLVGYVARGLVWLIIAFLLLRAASHHSSKGAGGPGEAFDFINRGSWGALILGTIAAGVIAYGIFCFVRAKYDRKEN